jgi:phage portal protein BeeE
MDFVEAKHAAAREIALAFGVGVVSEANSRMVSLSEVTRTNVL